MRHKTSRKTYCRISTAALALLTASAALVLFPSAVSAHDADDPAVDVIRYSGRDRYATSLEIARVFVDENGSVDTIVAASGKHWHDALVAPLVAANNAAPMMLVDPEDGWSDEQLDFLDDNGIESVIFINTDDVLGQTAYSQVADLGIDTESISSTNRYLTAAAAANRSPAPSGFGNLGSTVIVASGEVFADALAAGPVSYQYGLPILLTSKNSLHSSVSSYVEANNIDNAIVMGGTAALSSRVSDGLEDLGLDVSRLAGKTRFETAIYLADFVSSQSGAKCFGPSNASVGLATALRPYDAFSAAPLLGELCAPLVFTFADETPDATTDFLARYRHNAAPKAMDLYVLGGTTAIDAEVARLSGTAHYTEYENRSQNSQLPANDEHFIDHNEVAALFPQCPRTPISKQWHPRTLETLDRHHQRFSGFDTVETTGVDGFTVATGWFTDEAVQYQWNKLHPDMTASQARNRIRMGSTYRFVFQAGLSGGANDWDFGPVYGQDKTRPRSLFAGLAQKLSWNPRPPEWKTGSDRVLLEQSTNRHTVHFGFTEPQLPADESDPEAQRPFRIPPDEAISHPGASLLHGFTYFMYQYPPIYREPGVWGLKTLIDNVDPNCVYKEMYELCDLPITDALSPHLRHDRDGSQLGAVLRNIVCAQSVRSIDDPLLVGWK